MVYLGNYAIAKSCASDFYSIEAVPVPAVEKCQQEATAPYCWPPNGSRICIPDNKVEFYWPPRYYNDSVTSRLSIEVNGNTINEAGSAGAGRSGTYLDLNFLVSETLSLPNEYLANVTVTERRMANDSWGSYLDYTWHHQGPVLILVSATTTSSPSQTSSIADQTSTQTPSATSPSSANGPRVFTPAEIAGLGIGSFFALLLFAVLAYRCCGACCLACCFPGDTERRRVKAAERRRVAQERVYLQPQVDAIKAAVARGEVWQGPTRPGVVWGSRSRGPAVARAVRMEERGEGSDDITAVGGHVGDGSGEQWMEEQRRELERIETRRREGESVPGRREENTRTEEERPPAYEVLPPKYTP
ncbi:hypothetical protein SLS61_003462 [Didymella pomorum]